MGRRSPSSGGLHDRIALLGGSRRSVVAPALADLVEIGDYATLNDGVVIQKHLFEDRVSKSSHLKIGRELSVGNMTVILYDT